MIKSSTHYELLARKGGGWSVIDVLPAREPAMQRAEALWASRQYQGVKLLKETYDQASGSFSSIALFQRGITVKKAKDDRKGEITPCLTPNDIYSLDGRRTIWDLLHNSLSDWAITPTELLHALYHYYRLYNAGMKLEDAIQRTVVSYEDDEDSIQARMRKLRKVIDACVDMLKAAEKHIPVLEVGRLKPVTKELEGKSNRAFLLTASIANYLKPALSVEDKFGRLIVFLTPNRPDWVQEILDQYISEQIMIPKLLRMLAQDHMDHRSFLLVLSGLAGGRLDELADKDLIRKLPQELVQLGSYIGDGLMPHTARVLRDRLLLEIGSTKPLTEGSPYNHVCALNDVKAQIMVQSFDATFMDNVVEVVKSRMARLINSQTVGDHLHEVKEPFAQVHFLLDLCHVTVGDSNKRLVANIIIPLLNLPQNETIFMGLDGKPLARMPELVDLQKKVLTTDMSEMQRRKIAERLDLFCRAVLDSTDIMRKIHQMPDSNQQKAVRVLRMLADGYFTEGDARDRAEAQALIYMRTENFTEGLLAETPDEAPQKVLLRFRDLLTAAGLARSGETSTVPESSTMEEVDQAVAQNLGDVDIDVSGLPESEIYDDTPTETE